MNVTFSKTQCIGVLFIFGLSSRTPSQSFDANTVSQQLCAQNVWGALFDAFPLKHKRMQTILLASEMNRMMRWDGDSKRDVNIHFEKVNETSCLPLQVPR
jgi:hypothetical protein